MILSDDKLMEVPFNEMNGVGLCRRFYGGVQTAEFRRDYTELMKRFKTNRAQIVWFKLRWDKVEGLMKSCTKPQEIADALEIPYSRLQDWLKRMDVWPFSREVSTGISFMSRVRQDKLFPDGRNYSFIESYMYGYYLGDGSTLHCGERPNGLLLMCGNTKDFGNFKRLEDLLGCGNLIQDRQGRKVMCFYSRNMLKRLESKQLLFIAKDRRHPKLLPAQLMDFDFNGLFRGLVDADGSLIKGKLHDRELVISNTWYDLIDCVGFLLRKRGVEFAVSEQEPSGKMKSVCYHLKIKREGLRNLLSQGLYQEHPELCIERKRVTRV